VVSLSNSAHDPIKAALGKSKFAACGACHGADGKGMQALGAPNLTDKIWLYGGGVDSVMETINKGRDNQMPAHRAILSDAKVHLLTAYVWGLSNQGASFTKVETGAVAPVTNAAVDTKVMSDAK
jgi:cytochrome c oxidase cbb3-type subunit 3